MNSARFDSKGREVRQSFMKDYQPRLETAEAVVVVTRRDVRGEAQEASFEQDGVVVATRVPISHVNGVGDGARVAFDHDPTRSEIYPQNVRVVNMPPSSYNPGGDGPLSTPEISEIISRPKINNGTVLAHGALLVECIPEQLANFPVQYELEIAEDDGAGNAENVVFNTTVPGQAMGAIGGKLLATLTAAATDWNVYPIGSGSGYTSTWPGDYFLCQIEDEKILVRRANNQGGNIYAFIATDSVELESGRGYDGTTAAEHDSGSLVRMLARPIPFSGLRPNTIYWYRVRARGPNTRLSAWTDWVGHTTEYDVTPPDWEDAPITPTVTGHSNYFRIDWPPVDVEIQDLAYYEVDISDDGEVTWLSDTDEQENSGNGNFHIKDASPGHVRWFRVRAVDTTGNASDWSNSVKGVAFIDIPDTPELFDNPSFETHNPIGSGQDFDEWYFAMPVTEAEMHRVATALAIDGDYVAEITVPRHNSGPNIEGYLSPGSEFGSIAVGAGERYLLWACVRPSDTMDSGDSIRLTARTVSADGMTGFAYYETAEREPVVDEWMIFFIEVNVPEGAEYIRPELRINWHNDDTGDDPFDFQVDFMGLRLMEQSDDPIVRRAYTSSNPGAAARVLKTDSSGNFRAEGLALGAAISSTERLRLQVEQSAGDEYNNLVMYSEGEHVFERDQLDSGANGTVLGLRRRNMDDEGRSVLRLTGRRAGDAAPGAGFGVFTTTQLPDFSGSSDQDVGWLGFVYDEAPDGVEVGGIDGEVRFEIGGIGETLPYIWVQATVAGGWQQRLNHSIIPPTGDATLTLDSGRDATPAASAIKFLHDEVEYYRIAKTAAHDLVLNRYTTGGVYIDSPLIISGANGEVRVGKQMQFTEMTAPSAPSANEAEVFAQDNGAGKTQLCVRFATGAIQVLATEP